MAVPVVRWIGRRIEDACRRTEEERQRRSNDYDCI
jgi:hypothetical protein